MSLTNVDHQVNGPINLVHYLNWFSHIGITLSDEKEDRYFRSSNQSEVAFTWLLETQGKGVLPTEVYVPEKGKEKLYGYDKDGETKIELEFSEGQWRIVWSDLSDKDFHFFKPYNFAGNKREIPLNFNEEFVERYLDNIDDVFYRRNGINIYKNSELGYYTTNHQLVDVDLKTINELFGNVTPNKADSKVGLLDIIAALEKCGILYNSELLIKAQMIIRGLDETRLAKTFNINYTDVKLLGRTRMRKFIIIPILEHYAVSVVDTNSPIEFINLETGKSYRLWQIE